MLDLTTVATLLGIRPDVPGDPFGAMTGDFAADSAALIRRRIEAARRAAAEAEATS